MKTRGFKLFDDGNDAVKLNTPFRVCYFINEDERFLYFSTREAAFEFVQNNPNIERPEIKDLRCGEVLYPPELRP